MCLLVHTPPQVGPHICVFKTHVDVFDRWSDEYAARLQALAEKHGGWAAHERGPPTGAAMVLLGRPGKPPTHRAALPAFQTF